MKLAIASDHGGFHLKQAILNFLSSRKIQYVDLGVASEDSVDYPDYAAQVAQKVVGGEVDGGILVCGTGIGMAISANKVAGIRAANVSTEYEAQMSREHNDANVLALGGRVVDETTANAIVDKWLSSSFLGGRHQRRVDKIMDIERHDLQNEDLQRKP